MNEGEKDKVKFKRGDNVTFRLVKRLQYSDAVIDMLNESYERGSLNHEIIHALEFYTKYKHLSNQESLNTDKKASQQEELHRDKYTAIDIVATRDKKEEIDEIFEEKIQVLDKRYSTSIPSEKIIEVDWNQNQSNQENNDADDELFQTNVQQIRPIIQNEVKDKPTGGLAMAFKSIKR